MSDDITTNLGGMVSIPVAELISKELMILWIVAIIVINGDSNRFVVLVFIDRLLRQTLAEIVGDRLDP